MPELSIQRIPFTVDADSQLRMLKARTGLTPNILCRLGFCLSLEEPGIPTDISNNEKYEIIESIEPESSWGNLFLSIKF